MKPGDGSTTSPDDLILPSFFMVQVSEPFVRAGIVTFRQRKIRTSPEDRVEALNECVARYRHMRDSGNPSAPRWVVLINTDEYFWAGDLVSTLSDVLMMYSSTCCLQVNMSW